jgi:hypothetical protein
MKAIFCVSSGEVLWMNRNIEMTRKMNSSNKQRINSHAAINFRSYFLKFVKGLKA